MATRLAMLALVIAAIAQLANVWPLPDEMARRTVAYWTDLRSKAEAIDPSKSERPVYDAKARAQILQTVDSMLGDPSRIRQQAWLHWLLWLGSAGVAAVAAIAVLRQWRYLLAVAGTCVHRHVFLASTASKCLSILR
jgi:hypothetical protein